MEMVAKMTSATNFGTEMPSKWKKMISSVQSTGWSTCTNLATSPMSHIWWIYRQMHLDQSLLSKTYVNYPPSLRNLQCQARQLADKHCRRDASHYMAVSDHIHASICWLVTLSIFAICVRCMPSCHFRGLNMHLSLVSDCTADTAYIYWGSLRRCANVVCKAG